MYHSVAYPPAFRKNPVMTKAQLQLLNAFFELCDTSPYAEISISQICARAGVSRMSFYRSFSTKEEMLQKSIYAIGDYYQRLIPEEQVDSLQKFIAVYFETYREHSQLLDVLYKTGHMEMILFYLDDEFCAIAAGKPDKEQKMLQAHMWAGAIANILYHWYESGMKQTGEEMSRMICGCMASNRRFFEDRELLEQEYQAYLDYFTKRKFK